MRACRTWMVAAIAWMVLSPIPAPAQVAVRAKVLYPVTSAPLRDRVILIRDGKITKIGRAKSTVIPGDLRVIQADVVTPGLVDAHTVVGLAGIFNQKHDQDQLERSSPVQPELRAIDAYNPKEELVEWVRSFGVTTIHTGHAPGELVSGQTMVVKTYGNTVEDALLKAPAAISATFGPAAQKKDGKSPGTRGKMMAMLRSDLVKAREHLKKSGTAEKPDRDLKLEALGLVLQRKIPMMITANKAQDIVSVLRLKEEFRINVIIDSGSESYLVLDELAEARVPVIVHPPMVRAWGEMKNASFETPAKLKEAGILFAMQSGYESYVPKTRVVLFEAALASTNGLSFADALRAVTFDAARIIGVADRVGSIEVGKDGDLALFDGNPFEYTTHCTGVVIDGKVVSTRVR